MDLATRVLALSIGGALGVNARYFLAIAIDRVAGTRFPWATLAINVAGAFALGVLAALIARVGPHHPFRLLATVGFLGGFTTFSTFALESHKLWESGDPARSLAYMVGSVAAGLAAVTLGIALTRAIAPGDGPYPRRSASIDEAGGAMELAEVD